VTVKTSFAIESTKPIVGCLAGILAIVLTTAFSAFVFWLVKHTWAFVMGVLP
jgi:hypothetical protein